MHDGAGALHVLQEVMAKTSALRRAFNETRKICKDHSSIRIKFSDPQLRAERGERIGAHLGIGSANGAQERALAGIGKPNEPHIGNQFQFNQEASLNSQLAGRALQRSLLQGTLEMLVAKSAGTAGRYHRRLTGDNQIHQEFPSIRISHHGANWQPNLNARAVRAVATLLHALAAIDRKEVRTEREFNQRVEVRIRHHHYIAAATTVAAVRTTLGAILLTTQMRGTVAALAGSDINDGCIDEDIHGVFGFVMQ